MIVAIHTIFILKENILFLEEWINYHLALGFNKFYLYDNSKVKKGGGAHIKHSAFKTGKVNKYGINYNKMINMGSTTIKKYMKQLLDKYKCVRIVEWSPRDFRGVIEHAQVKGHNHCLGKILRKRKVDWCAVIDMDEFIMLKNFDNIQNYIKSLPKDVSNVKMGQKLFDSRFNNKDKYVLDIRKIDKEQVPRSHSNKNLFRVKDTASVGVHNWIPKSKKNKQITPPLNVIWFNHYKMNRKSYKETDNVHPNLRKKLEETRSNYIIMDCENSITKKMAIKTEKLKALLSEANKEIQKIENDLGIIEKELFAIKK